MKIFGLEHNYHSQQAPHHTAEPSLLQIADVAMLASGKPFILPADGHSYMAFPSAAVRIDRLGKGVRARFAPRYYSEATFGLNIRDVSLLERMRRDSLPWDEAISFDGSAPLGVFVPANEIFNDYAEIAITLSDRASDIPSAVMHYSPRCLRLGIDHAIELASRKCTIKNGDIIFAGFADCGIPLSAGLDIRCSLADRLLLYSKIR